MDFRNGEEPTMAEVEASLADSAEAETAAKAPRKASKEAGEGPALPMTDKNDAGSAGLVEKLGAEALASAVAAAAAPKDDSKAIDPRPRCERGESKRCAREGRACGGEREPRGFPLPALPESFHDHFCIPVACARRSDRSCRRRRNHRCCRPDPSPA